MILELLLIVAAMVAETDPVLQLFGSYTGTVREPGIHWANPLYWKTKISTRVRNFETGKLKVNDSHGSPIEISAVVELDQFRQRNNVCDLFF